MLISVVVFATTSIFEALKRLIGRPVPGIFVVLYYHGIPRAHREGFARQMDMLRSLAKPVRGDFRGPLEDATVHVAVTFDDGFQSVVDNALDALVSRGIHSTHFVPSAVLGKRPPWEMEPGVDDCVEVVVTREQLAALPSDLVTIGSHARTHPHLPRLDSAEAERELRGSRDELEAVIGRPVELFSFPYGEYSEVLLEQCRRAGYERVFSVSPRLGLESPNEYLTGRVSVAPDDSPLEFRLKLLGAYRWRPAASALKRRVRTWL